MTAPARVAGPPLVALLRMELLLLRRNRVATALSVVMPLVVGFLWARGFGDDVASGIAGIAGAIGMAAVFSVHYMLTAVLATRRQEGVLHRLRAGLLADRTILLGTALGAGVVFTVQAILLMALGIVGLGLPVPAQPVPMLLGLAGTAAVLAALAMVLSGLTRDAEAALLTTLPTVLLMLVTPGVLVPAAHVGPAPYTIVFLTPMGAGTALRREGWAGADLGVVAGATGVLLAWLVGSLLLAQRLMRWAPRAG